MCDCVRSFFLHFVIKDKGILRRYWYESKKARNVCEFGKTWRHHTPGLGWRVREISFSFTNKGRSFSVKSEKKTSWFCSLTMDLIIIIMDVIKSWEFPWSWSTNSLSMKESPDPGSGSSQAEYLKSKTIGVQEGKKKRGVRTLTDNRSHHRRWRQWRHKGGREKSGDYG